MVATETAAVPPPAATAPSMGPSSIPYVPPITLEDAVTRARVRIRLRNRRGSFALVVSVVLLSLPFVLALAALFPSQPGAAVSLGTFLLFLGIAGALLFFSWAVYRIIQDRTAVTYPVAAIGAALIVYGAIEVVSLVQLYLAWNPTDTSLPADPNAYFVGMIVPLLILGAGTLAVLAGAFALPRRVSVVAA